MSISFHTITTVSMLVKISQKHVAKVLYKSISYKTWESHTEVAGLDDNRARITNIQVWCNFNRIAPCHTTSRAFVTRYTSVLDQFWQNLEVAIPD